MRLIEDVRSALVPLLSAGTWSDIEITHKKLNVPWREDLSPGWGKSKYAEKVLAEFDRDAIIALASRCLDFFPATDTLWLENAVWTLESGGRHLLTNLTRKKLAGAFDGQVLHPSLSPSTLLEQFWPVANTGDGTTNFCYSAGQLIAERVSFDIFGVWPEPEPSQRSLCSHRDLFAHYEFEKWPDQRVFRFLEALVAPEIRRGPEQEFWVALINSVIRYDGFALNQCGTVSGHPAFEVQRAARLAVPGKPKNLIFAAIGPKPEIGFSDAINNDIVILKNSRHCLVYDEPFSPEGLRWSDLVRWWAERNNLPADIDCRRHLGRRLQQSLASDPERNLFHAYFQEIHPLLGEDLPALIPQVYLHYDPVTLRQLRERGEDRRFEAQRMDFLLLLPDQVRVVVEVDGQQHYSETAGDSLKPSPRVYAQTTAADRNLRLLGYEVYRFGGYELSEVNRARRNVALFFRRLFDRHRVSSTSHAD